MFLKYARAALDIGAQAASLLPYKRHTIRDAIQTRAPKLAQDSLIYRTEPTTTKRKTEKLKRKIKTDMLKTIGKQKRATISKGLFTAYELN